jgi:hypothetical protein
MRPIMGRTIKDNTVASVTIDKRQKANGESSYRCTIRVKKNGVIIHRESKTFSKKELAKTWGKIRREAVELNSITPLLKIIPISELLDLYINDVDLWTATGRTKQYVIKMVRDCPIANILSNELKSSDLITHCKMRRDAGAGGATIYHDVAYLRSVMKIALAVFDVTANWKIFEDAVPVLIGKGIGNDT